MNKYIDNKCFNKFLSALTFTMCLSGCLQRSETKNNNDNQKVLVGYPVFLDFTNGMNKTEFSKLQTRLLKNDQLRGTHDKVQYRMYTSDQGDYIDFKVKPIWSDNQLEMVYLVSDSCCMNIRTISSPEILLTFKEERQHYIESRCILYKLEQIHLILSKKFEVDKNNEVDKDTNQFYSQNRRVELTIRYIEGEDVPSHNGSSIRPVYSSIYLGFYPQGKRDYEASVARKLIKNEEEKKRTKLKDSLNYIKTLEQI